MENFIPKISDIFPFENPNHALAWTVEVYAPLDDQTAFYRVAPTPAPQKPDHFCLEITRLNFHGSLELGPCPLEKTSGSVPKTLRQTSALIMPDIDEEISRLMTHESDSGAVKQFLQIRANFTTVAQNIPPSALPAVCELTARALFSDAIRNYYRKPQTLEEQVNAFGREVGGSIVLGLWKNDNRIECSIRGRGLETTPEFADAKNSRAKKFPDIASMQRQMAPQVKLLSLLHS